MKYIDYHLQRSIRENEIRELFTIFFLQKIKKELIYWAGPALFGPRGPETEQQHKSQKIKPPLSQKYRGIVFCFSEDEYGVAFWSWHGGFVDNVVALGGR